ncbi:MAG: TlpA family protein disulfide reductase [Prevotellaceae bacterium]|jgi:peroxiredoxin|nr:TlpA family protein disulfide reductase [Prevotellaceae bacterium]
MKKILLIVCALGLISSCTQKNTIEIPFSVQNGYGVFKSAFGGISPDSEDENNQWKKTYLQVSGIPDEWTDAKKGHININIYQDVYQNYLQGNITQEWYDELQKSWNWTPDTLNLSKKPLKNKVAFAFGKDATGKIQMIVDANNNLDFSDDAMFTPLELDLVDNSKNKDSLMQHNSIMVTYERLSDNQIVQEKVPLCIVYAPQYGLFMCNFSQYIVAAFDGMELAINSNDFINLSYSKTGIILVDDSLKNGGKVERENTISENEYLTLNEKIYKYKGVNTNKNVVILEKTNLPQNQLHATQIGFKTIPFEGYDFKTKTKISLDNYKGKYLFIDFWAVWCSPCIQELPNLKILYDSLDKSKIEILGIVGDSKSEALDKMIEQYSITWAQILSDDENTITKKYRITGYPTTLLINPEGIIIAKNLRGKALENKINELLSQ